MHAHSKADTSLKEENDGNQEGSCSAPQEEGCEEGGKEEVVVACINLRQ